jgi:hypothetical protein
MGKILSMSAQTPQPPTTFPFAKKQWSKLFTIFVRDFFFNLNTYSWKNSSKIGQLLHQLLALKKWSIFSQRPYEPTPSMRTLLSSCKQRPHQRGQRRHMHPCG